MFAKDNFKVLMVDSLVGSDYSIFICSGLKNKGVDISLIMTEDLMNECGDYKFPIILLSPSKDEGTNKVNKYLNIFTICGNYI